MDLMFFLNRGDKMKNDERLVAYILESKISLEWIRYNMYDSDDIYRNIPILVFRFDETCNESISERLNKVITSFSGIEKWCIFRHPVTRKETYILSIEQWRDILFTRDKMLLEKKIELFKKSDEYRKCCKGAIEDIPLLAKYIEENL